MKSVINKLALIIPIILFIPTLAILVSWNALPGDSLYPVKRCLEKIALFLVSPSDRVKADLQSNLVERRTYEATKTVTQTGKSSIALKELEYQVEAAATAVQTTKDPATRQQASLKLISKLEEAKSNLEATKNNSSTPINSPISTPAPTSKPVPHQTPLPALTSPSPTLVPAHSPTPTGLPASPTPRPQKNIDNPADNIDETNKLIDSTIEKLRQQTELTDDQQNEESDSKSHPQRQNNKQEEHKTSNDHKKNRD